MVVLLFDCCRCHLMSLQGINCQGGGTTQHAQQYVEWVGAQPEFAGEAVLGHHHQHLHKHLTAAPLLFIVLLSLLFMQLSIWILEWVGVYRSPQML